MDDRIGEPDFFNFWTQCVGTRSILGLDLPLVNIIVYISPNFSGGGMLKIFIGMRYPLTAQLMKIFLINGWERLLGVRM